MVCIHIYRPKIGLLSKRCEVGVGASDPMRRLLMEEGLLHPTRSPGTKGGTSLKKREGADMNGFEIKLSLKQKSLYVERDGLNIIHVFFSTSTSMDRAYTIAERLRKLASQKRIHTRNHPTLLKKRRELLSKKTLRIQTYDLGHMSERPQARFEGEVQQERANSKPEPSEALMRLGARINESKTKSAKHFWTLLQKVEIRGRLHFKDMPLVIEQMKTKRKTMSAATLQVQLCEFRQ